MKKPIIVLMTILCVLTLAGCAKEKEPAVINEEETPEILGGWNINESSEASLDDETRAVFDNALEGLVGTQFKPVALLGTQVVSGRNCAFLCEKTTVTNPPQTDYAIVYVYEDLTGNASVLAVKEIEVDPEAVVNDSALAGGWNLADEMFANPNDEDKNLLEKAQEGYVGMTFELISCIADQLVSGTNRLMICKGTTVTLEPVSRLVLVKVYENLQNEAEIAEVYNLILSAEE